MDLTLSSFRPSSTVLLALGLMGILVMMVVPVPPIVLDLGLTLSFAFSILIFVLTLFVQRPLDFSSFPAILLMSLLLRLALNISSTKLIIGEGHTGTSAAGGVIEGFAMFIMGGNLAMGLIIFSVLIIVNFLVITKGAGRMAEVGARFALDAMPGKQLAIDSDVAAGAITHEEARRLREREQEETAFLGSLDGASKFVKGDAVAGLLITILNLVAGIAVGLLVHGLSIGEAISNYSVLTVGDGLVSQIPAVIVSVAAALLLSKGRSEKGVDLALIAELGARPEALVTVGSVLVLFALFPGLPLLPFLTGAGILFYLAWRGRNAKAAEETPAEEAAPDPVADARPSLADLLDIDDIHVELSRDLVRTVIEREGGFDTRVEKIRRYVVQEYGFIMPPVRVTDRLGMTPGTYEIRVHGVKVATNLLRPGCYLALIAEDAHPEVKGEMVREPVYGAAARWVDQAGKEALVVHGATIVDPIEVLSTHLLETVQANFHRLMTRSAMRTMLDTFAKPSDPERAEAHRRFLDDLVPDRVPYDLLQQVLRDLLSERISVRNLPIILEAISEARTPDASTDTIVEHVRRRLAFQFVSRLADGQGDLPVIQIGKAWDRLLPGAEEDGGPDKLSDLAARIKTVLDQASAGGAYPALAVPGPRRRFFRQLLSGHKIPNPVLAFEEISGNAAPKVMGVA